MQTKSAVMTLSACLLALAGAASPARAQARPDLSGTWRLDEKESDDAREKLREASRRGGGGGGFQGRGGAGGRGGGFGGGGRRGGFGGAGGGPAGGPGGPEGGGQGGAERLERLQERYAKLQIRHTEPALEVEYGDQRAETFYTDGRKVKRDVGERGLVEIQAKWKDDRVVIERDRGRGKASETFELAEGGRRLVVVSKLDGPFGSVTIKRVYDRDTGDASPADAPPAGDR